MNWKSISKYIGAALLVSALFMLIAAIISLTTPGDSASAALMISFLITALVGSFPFIFVKKTQKISLKEGYIIITLSWLLSFIFGMLPYSLWGGPFTLQNAIFESVSGYTTCGATILDNVEALPSSLLFWRAATHFIGGLGVVVFLLLVIPEASHIRMRLTNMELSDLSKNAYSLRSSKIVSVFAFVYLAIFFLATVAYWLAGMTFLDAVCHAMSVVATGGFSTKNLSIGAYDSKLIEGITMFFMYLASLHFGLIFISFITRSLKLFKNEVVRWYTAEVVILSIILAFGLSANDYYTNFGESLWSGLFNVLSISSTTGFAIIDNDTWPSWMVMLLCFSGIVCGCAGSTSGGLKMDRGLLLIKTIGKQVLSILSPSAVDEVRIGRNIVKYEDIAAHTLYMCLYFLLIIISTILASSFGIEFEESLLASVMCISDVGPACGDFSLLGSYNSAPEAAKMLFSLDMFLGRLEIYPLLAIVGMIFEKKAK